MDEINKDSREMTNPVLTNNEEVEKPKEEERDFYHDTKELVAETGKKYFVLADMLELGEKSKEAHAGIGSVLLNSDFTKVILVGKEMNACVQVLKENNITAYEYYETNSKENFTQIAQNLTKLCQNGDVIVFKGSHSMALENIIIMKAQLILHNYI